VRKLDTCNDKDRILSCINRCVDDLVNLLHEVRMEALLECVRLCNEKAKEFDKEFDPYDANAAASKCYAAEECADAICDRIPKEN
jgi:hypothetical protein